MRRKGRKPKFELDEKIKNIIIEKLLKEGYSYTTILRDLYNISLIYRKIPILLKQPITDKKQVNKILFKVFKNQSDHIILNIADSYMRIIKYCPEIFEKESNILTKVQKLEILQEFIQLQHSVIMLKQQLSTIKDSIKVMEESINEIEENLKKIKKKINNTIK